MYRGHAFTDISCALRTALHTGPEGKTAPEPAGGEAADFRVTAKQEIVPNTHMVTVHAPAVAEYCKPGQFMIAMVGPQSERIPYTIADWDRDSKTVTFNVLEAGRSSGEMPPAASMP